MNLKIFKLSLLIVLLILTASCSHDWKSYVVKKGKHSVNGMGRILINTDEIEFLFRADSSWYYKEQAHPGWNKIRGISHGHHQRNSSARLGYQCWHDSVLVVGAYCYANGVSPQENDAQKGIIDTIQPGITYHCSIKKEDGTYIIKFEDKTWTGPAGENKNWGYLLNPYIGGEFTLDHDWKVDIKDEK